MAVEERETEIRALPGDTDDQAGDDDDPAAVHGKAFQSRERDNDERYRPHLPTPVRAAMISCQCTAGSLEPVANLQAFGRKT